MPSLNILLFHPSSKDVQCSSTTSRKFRGISGGIKYFLINLSHRIQYDNLQRGLKFCSRVSRPLLCGMQHTQNVNSSIIFRVYHNVVRFDDHFPCTGDATLLIHLWMSDQPRCPCLYLVFQLLSSIRIVVSNIFDNCEQVCKGCFAPAKNWHSVSYQ